MSNSEGQFKVVGGPRPALAAVAALGMLLAACGGGGGGGNGAGSYTLRVSIGNETADTATLAMEGGESYEIESCKGGVFSFAMPATDFILTVNGQTAIDSLEIEANNLDNDLAAKLWLNEDGTVDVQSILPGSNISPPTALGICT